MPNTGSVILVHDETESVLDTLFTVTDNAIPSTRCIVFAHNQDSRQLGPRLHCNDQASAVMFPSSHARASREDEAVFLDLSSLVYKRIEISMAHVFGAPKYLAVAFKILVILALSSLFQIAAARYVSCLLAWYRVGYWMNDGHACEKTPPYRRAWPET